MHCSWGVLSSWSCQEKETLPSSQRCLAGNLLLLQQSMLDTDAEISLQLLWMSLLEPGG